MSRGVFRFGTPKIYKPLSSSTPLCRSTFSFVVLRPVPLQDNNLAREAHGFSVTSFMATKGPWMEIFVSFK